MAGPIIEVVHDDSGITVLCRGTRSQCGMVRAVAEALITMLIGVREPAPRSGAGGTDAEKIAEYVLELQRRFIKKLEDLIGGA